MSENRSLSIDVISDVMCPWCFIGQKNLERALEQVSDIDVAIHWRPYQLDPTLPPEGKDRQTYLEEKFGSRERAQALYDRVREAGRDAGIDFKFDRIEKSPNTLDAHRVIRWAASAGEGVQDKLVRRLFELYFLEGANIGSHAVLIQAARDSGMDSAVVETLLPTEADLQEVSQEVGIAALPVCPASFWRANMHCWVHSRQRRWQMPFARFQTPRPRARLISHRPDYRSGRFLFLRQFGELRHDHSRA